MSNEKDIMLDELEDLLKEGDDNGNSNRLNFQTIYTMLILNWQWFLLSLFICLCGAMIYLRYVTPVYKVSSKILIKEDDNRNSRNSTYQMLANMQDFGFLSNSEGIQNEVEILQSHILARDAVKDLKLYVDYYTPGNFKNKLVYKTQPICVDMDSATLEQWDNAMQDFDSLKSIKLTITKFEEYYEVNGETLLNGKTSNTFTQNCTILPANVETGYGVLTLSKNEGWEMEVDESLLVTIVPPMNKATSYVESITIKPISKQTSIAELTLTDYNTLRGKDYLRQLAVCYNRQANIDKNEIAMKTEEFINVRLTKIDTELGTTESALENYKKNNAVINIMLDATQSLAQRSLYESKLTEINTQIQLLDYLREFVDNPDNQYTIIPSNIGMNDQASTALINSYNQNVLERNRYLKTSSLQAPHVVSLSSTLDDMLSSIRTALVQARHSADTQRQSLLKELSKYQGRIGNTPEQERVLTQIGRQQEVRAGLYLLLLQKREENSISLAATVDKGKLIDVPLAMGIVSPKKLIILMAAIIFGLGIPFAVLCLIQLLRYRIEGHDDLSHLTKLPIVADVPMASNSVKSAAGIVVQANSNNQIDEIFRSMRSNIQFMMKENDKVILFTSSTTGEGKSFLSANLAMSFALLGKKVILCGLDIRKPALGHLFGFKDQIEGVTQLLVKNEVTESDLHNIICPSGINDHLDLLLAGSIPPNPTELLARENLNTIIELLKQQYDYVILDTAPVGLVTDPLEISRYADVNCYVCRADYTPKADINIMNTLASEKKLSNCCVILNGVDMSKKKYGYYYGYGKYGKYGRYGYGKYGYGNYGNYADSNYSNEADNSIKK